MATTRSTRGTLLGIALAALAAVPSPAAAQATATVAAHTGQSCAGTRAAQNLGCTAKDFTTTATFTQPPPGIASCVAGETIAIDVMTTIASGAAERYDGAVFLGEWGNDPSLNDAARTCSLGVFPTSPAPFQDVDLDEAGDFLPSRTATLAITGAVARCAPVAGSNVLGLPYTLVFDSNTKADQDWTNVTAGGPSKCVNTLAAQVTGVVVQGWIRLTVQTTPDGDPQAFPFTATGGAAASPASFSLADGQTQLVQIPLSPTGGTQTLQLDEGLVPSWVPTAAITCTSPAGGPAPWVTVDGAARRITATLDATNYGANCTVANTKLLPNLLFVKSADVATARPGDVVTYTLQVQNGGPGEATDVELSDALSRHLAWAVDGFGPGAPFEFSDGSPASGVTPGAPSYSADGGVTWTLVPASGGGGAPPGFDARVTAWRLPMAGSLRSGGDFTLRFRTAVK